MLKKKSFLVGLLAVMAILFGNYYSTSASDLNLDHASHQYEEISELLIGHTVPIRGVAQLRTFESSDAPSIGELQAGVLVTTIRTRVVNSDRWFFVEVRSGALMGRRGYVIGSAIPL
jgi:hypothetical protein